jgi:diguanylate cyclase (GGDEF)-like protein
MPVNGAGPLGCGICARAHVTNGEKFLAFERICTSRIALYSPLESSGRCGTTMTGMLILLGAAVAIAVLATLLVATRRSERAADRRVAAAVADLNTRMDTVVQELRATVMAAEAETRRSKALSELAGSIDLDEVLARVLESAVQVTRADAGLVSLDRGESEKRLVATMGLSAEEAEREGIVTGPPDGRPARAIGMTYSYEAELDALPDLIRAGLAVPLVVDGERIGHIAVFTREIGRTFDDEDLDELEALGRRGAPAIENARRFREARRLADLDALTGLHNRRYFHETLGREIARAQRYGRRLALVVFDLDDFKAINDKIGHLAGDAVLAGAAERLQEAVRTADIACRVGGDEFAVILPESDLADAEQLYHRIQESVSARPIADAGTVTLSAGIAELRPDDDPARFFERADGALYRAKDHGKARVTPAAV